MSLYFLPLYVRSSQINKIEAERNLKQSQHICQISTQNHKTNSENKLAKPMISSPFRCFHDLKQTASHLSSKQGEILKFHHICQILSRNHKRNSENKLVDTMISSCHRCFQVSQEIRLKKRKKNHKGPSFLFLSEI